MPRLTAHRHRQLLTAGIADGQVLDGHAHARAHGHGRVRVGEGAQAHPRRRARRAPAGPAGDPDGALGEPGRGLRAGDDLRHPLLLAALAGPARPLALRAPLGAAPGPGLPPAVLDDPGVRRLGPVAPSLRLPGPRRRPAPPLLAAERLAVPQPGELLGPAPLRPPVPAVRVRAHARAARLPRVASPLAVAAGCARAPGARLRGPAGGVHDDVLTPARTS